MFVSWLPAAKLMEVNADAPANAPLPMLVALAGMVMEVSPDAKANEYSPMLVTPSGIE